MRILHRLVQLSLTRDAVELCGPANQSVIDFLSTPCEDSEGFEIGFPTITTSRGFDRDKYALPPFRLYVCHPGSAKKGWLFDASGQHEISSSDDLKDVSGKLFKNQLWPLKETWKGFFWRQIVWIYHQYMGDTPDGNPAVLWVLDKNGNLVIAPEQQESVLYKHGDLTPGHFPWSRPTKNSKSKNGVCCCVAQSPQAECLSISRQETCCQVRVSQCAGNEKTSSWNLCEGRAVEKRQAGRYRGIARAGGELRFVDEDKYLVQNKSGYMRQRVSLDRLPVDRGEKMSRGDVERIIVNTALSPRPGPCGMRRLGEYWSKLFENRLETVEFGLSDPDMRLRCQFFLKVALWCLFVCCCCCCSVRVCRKGRARYREKHADDSAVLDEDKNEVVVAKDDNEAGYDVSCKDSSVEGAIESGASYDCTNFRTWW